MNGITGFGSNLLFVPLAALVIGPKEAVIVCSALNPFAFGTLLRVESKNVPRSYWLPLCCALVVGNIIGAFTLHSIPNEVFGPTLGVLVLLLGIWFLGGRRGGDSKGLSESFPDASSRLDSLVCGFAGFCGGAFGISGPPLAWHFGRKFAKTAFRKAMALMFFPASIFRIGTYLFLGMVSKELCWFIVASLPFMLAGTYAGNHVFAKLSLSRFNILVGGVLIITACKLLLPI